MLLKNLSDQFVHEPAAKFPPGKRVLGRVLSVDQESGRIDLSLRKSAVAPQSVRTPPHRRTAAQPPRPAAVARPRG